MLQFLRKARLVLQGKTSGIVVNPGDATDDQMKIAFVVAKGITGTANTAEIEVWNLSEGHRNAVGKEFDGVTLEAGYIPHTGGQNVGIIFKGAIRDVEHRRERADIVTKITCGDGDEALRKAVKSETYPAGTTPQKIVESLSTEFEKHGIARGEWKGLDKLPPYRRPYSVCGTCEREMNRLGRSHGFYWSMQNEALEIIPGNGYINATAYLTPRTGLIGVPAITDNGVKAEALLNPEVRPNRKVIIESETLEMNAEGGEYRVSEATYTGDNRSGEFKVIIVGERIEGGKVDEGVKD